MRIVLDLQALQTPSRFRGVGRYVMGLTQGIIRNRGNHEIFLWSMVHSRKAPKPLNMPLRDSFPENIIKWYSPLPLKYFEPDGPEHQEVGGILQCYKILDLHPDMVVYGTLLADFAEDIACNFSILKKYTRLAIVIYDFYLSESRPLPGRYPFSALCSLYGCFQSTSIYRFYSYLFQITLKKTYKQ